ncbi:MAG: Asp-tRNA(Asn)/Glu-tRNA(Gln) amidotransferase subunit GatC [Planctomycetes bacterium]|nr:Asp-tRNA(Asn)/Glu-tRNA(Gln) amidotransferase subunit GatC [Planctomycetota bacterium]
MSEPRIQTVRRIAALARLEVGEEEARGLGETFERILGHFQVLARLDVSALEDEVGPIRPAEQRRADRPALSFPVELALRGAPAREDDFYRVPKTVGGEE